MPTANLYTGSTGISNRIHPELIPYDPKTGVVGLQQADNVLIGEAGQVYCRQGSRQIFSSESCHSPFKVSGEKFLFVQEKETGAFITLASPDNAGLVQLTEIGKLTYGGSWLSWFELDGEYWFSTERERGIVSADFKLENWPKSTGMMPGASEFKYLPLPFGRHSEQHGKFTLAGNGPIVSYSEPGQPSLCRGAEGFTTVEGPVKLIAPAQDGVYISDDKSVWYFQGREPGTWVTRRVLDYPAIEYCKVHGLVNSSDLGFETGGLGVAFMTTRGPCFGFSDGTVINLTEKQFAMPSGCDFQRGSMMIVNGSTLIISVE